MLCSKEESLIRLFYNSSSSFHLLLLFLYVSSILLSKIFHFLCTFHRAENAIDYSLFSDEEEEKDHLVVGDSLRFWDYYNPASAPDLNQSETEHEEAYHTTEQLPADEDSEKISTAEYSDTAYDSAPNHEDGPTSPTNQDPREILDKKAEARISADERFFILEPTSRVESMKKLPVEDRAVDHEEIEIFGDSCTVGSTSSDDPFSSSSRRSCRKWASYTVFQKYDEEMMFLHRITAPKLHQTESLRSFEANPRSISERIFDYKMWRNKRQSWENELEAAYVAQICIAWEALNCNYINFQRKRSVGRDGCPGRIAQQFQQFQVLLQRYIENEPYEHGRRPEVYTRMRLLAPNLLLVPEYTDSEEDEDEKEEGFGSRVSSASFLMIMEDGIRTFMNFLKADKERPCQVVRAFLFRRNKRGSVDPTLLNLMKKVNSKKKMKLKDLRRGGKCIRRKRLKVEEEMEILMGLIDLKVVSRVLRMSDISEEQLQWAEEKMSKVRVMEGKLQRDSTPLFFPPH